jgi:hypothetical protein
LMLLYGVSRSVGISMYIEPRTLEVIVGQYGETRVKTFERRAGGQTHQRGECHSDKAHLGEAEVGCDGWGQTWARGNCNGNMESLLWGLHPRGRNEHAVPARCWRHRNPSAIVPPFPFLFSVTAGNVVPRLDPDRVEPVKIIRGANLPAQAVELKLGTVMVSSSSFRTVY